MTRTLPTIIDTDSDPGSYAECLLYPPYVGQIGADGTFRNYPANPSAETCLRDSEPFGNTAAVPEALIPKGGV